MKFKVLAWNGVATWVWDIKNEMNCTICQLPFESPCPRCKTPGDDCIPSISYFIMISLLMRLFFS